MADKVSLNEQILEASMDIQQDANNYMQKINKITKLSPDILVMCYFRELWACWNIPNYNNKITMYFPWVCNYIQQINKIDQPFPEILAICYFGERLACPGMPDQTQQILNDLTKASIDI